MIRPAVAVLAVLAPLAAAPVLAQNVDATARYVITVGGINVALMDVNLKDDGARYALDLKANVTGLGSVVASGTATAKATGSSAGAQLGSQKFQLETRANGEQFNVNVDYDAGNVAAFTVNPAVLDSYDRVPVERRHLTGVADFLSSFVIKGGALDRSLCNRNLPIFTGVERFNIKTSYLKQDEATSPRTGYQGPLVACSLDYQPVSGHFTSSEMTSYLADTSRIIIWYAPLSDSGYFVPYRVILGTSMGDLSMVLTSMKS